jgi:hypothetical protein
MVYRRSIVTCEAEVAWRPRVLLVHGLGLSGRYMLPLAAKLPDVACPTLVVRGTKDPICRQDWAEFVARRLPLGRLAVIPEVAHTLCYTAPRELAEVARAFLDDPRPAICGSSRAQQPGPELETRGLAGSEHPTPTLRAGKGAVR